MHRVMLKPRRPARQRSMRRRRIGLLGGSFNPAHSGHRHISIVALHRLGLHEVWWLVSPQNPLKTSADMAPLKTRLERAAEAARHPRIRATEIECRLRTRYTADTVQALIRRYPDCAFVWLMGADNLLQLPKWRRWQTIMQTVPVAVFPRAPYSLKALAGCAAQRFAKWRLREGAAGRIAQRAAPCWIFLHSQLHPASATAIRAALGPEGAAAWFESDRPNHHLPESTNSMRYGS
jgi:nicotinate-nucleotide adenylyltransferase